MGRPDDAQETRHRAMTQMEIGRRLINPNRRKRAICDIRYARVRTGSLLCLNPKPSHPRRVRVQQHAREVKGTQHQKSGQSCRMERNIGQPIQIPYPLTVITRSLASRERSG